jgi:hypothetical protein
VYILRGEFYVLRRLVRPFRQKRVDNRTPEHLDNRRVAGKLHGLRRARPQPLLQSHQLLLIVWVLISWRDIQIVERLIRLARRCPVLGQLVMFGKILQHSLQIGVIVGQRRIGSIDSTIIQNFWVIILFKFTVIPKRRTNARISTNNDVVIVFDYFMNGLFDIPATDPHVRFGGFWHNRSDRCCARRRAGHWLGG